jgi:dTMP kinase
MICDLHRLVCDDLKPDLTLLFDLKPETGLARAWRQIDSGGRTDAESRFEQEKIDFHRKVRDGYLELARMEPHRFRLVDAQKDQGHVAKTIESLLTDFLDGR